MTAIGILQVTGVSEVLVFAVVFLVCVAIKVGGKRAGRYPPGPMGLPFIGYLPFLGRLPFLQFEKLRKRHGDIFSLKMGSRQCVVINGLGNLRKALALNAFSDRPDFKTFSYINEGKSLAFNNGGPTGRFHRKICVRALSLFLNTSHLSLRHILRDVSRKMRSSFNTHSGEPIEPQSIVRDNILSILFKVCFGRSVDIEKDEHFRKTRKTLDNFIKCHLKIFGIDFFPVLENILRGAVNEFKIVTQTYQNLLQEKLDEHLAVFKESDIKDAADALIQATDDNAEKMLRLGLGRREILHSVQDFVGAGSQTTSDVILWLLAVLALNPDIQDKIHHEVVTVDLEEGGVVEHIDFSRLPYLHACVLEVGRVRPVSPIAIPHATREDVTFGGYHIPARTLIFPNLCSVFLDESLYPNPHQFRPERFLLPDGSFNNSLADCMPMFGTGQRRCVGRLLAEQILAYLMCDLMRDFRFRAVPGRLPSLDGSLGLTWTPDPFVVTTERRFDEQA